jgi:glycosyltransferase involved in cell wall biosynthesis
MLNDSPLYVLLSTFNGEDFLHQLLESLNCQTYPIVVIWRDDGSNDESREVVEKSAIRLIECQHELGHIGVSRSYFHLLTHVPKGQSSAFCDQDDIWEAWKAEKSVNLIKMVEDAVPTLVVSQVKILGKADLWPKHLIQPSFYGSIFENPFPGCAMTLNWKLLEIVLKMRGLSEGLLHDEVCYLIGNATGVAIVSPKPAVQYRLHTKNDTGLRAYKTNSLHISIIRLLLFLRNRKRITKKLRILEELDSYKFLNPQSMVDWLELVDSRKLRLKILKKLFKLRQRSFENMVFKILWILRIL